MVWIRLSFDDDSDLFDSCSPSSSQASIVFDQFCSAPFHFEIFCSFIFYHVCSRAILLSSSLRLLFQLTGRRSNRGWIPLFTLVLALLRSGGFVLIVVVRF